MLLYIVRHGEPDYETDSLTELGWKQARLAAKRFVPGGLDRIFSSPMGRARQTAQPTAEALGLPVKIEHWTREIWPELAIPQPDGSLRFCMGLPGELFRSDENRLLGDNWHTMDALASIEGRQAWERVVRHSDNFLRRLGYLRERDGVYRVLRENNERVALFCHGGFTMTWLPHLLAIPPHLFWAAFSISHTGVTVVEFNGKTGETAAPMCTMLSDTGHLLELA